MTYRELIQLYKTGKLEEVQRQQVEADIERQEAISEYLFDAEEIPELKDLTVFGQMGEMPDEGVAKIAKTSEETEEDRFVKMIRASIRKAFVKMGFCVGTVLLCAILFILFALPGIVDAFYYQPDKIAAEGEYSTTNQMSLDFSVYSELFLPGKYRNNVVVNRRGYGEYDINIIQNASFTGAFYNVAGKVERGELHLYDVNLLTRPTGNAFDRKKAGLESNYVGMGAAGPWQQAYERLQTLDEREYVTAYVTLPKVLTYAEFMDWYDAIEVETNGVWCAVPMMTEDGYEMFEIIGFDCGASGVCINFDRENYPYLSLLDAGMDAFPENNPEIMQTHFVSMLRYMADQKIFCEMMGADEYYVEWEKFAENVETYGLHVYGFVTTAKPDALSELMEAEDCYVYTSPLQ